MRARRPRIARIAAATGAAAALLAGLFTVGQASASPSSSPSTPLAAPADLAELSAGWSIPWGMDWLPDGSALYTERDTHQVVHLTPEGERTELGTVPNVVGGGEGGLLGLAVSPDFATDQTFFVYHTAASDNRIARMTYDGTSIGGYEAILTGIEKSTNHNGGRLAFGPDGYLYAATGDAGDPDLSQDTDSLNGKILRLTPEGEPAPDNPSGNAVYSYGHRNVQGLAWDDQGRLWASELGQSTWDELNLIEPGNNYGWPICEGTCGSEGMTDPRQTWSTAEASPSGLAFAGDALYMAALRGERLWRIPVSGTETGTPEPYYEGELGRLRTVATVPEGGALWLSTTNGDRNRGVPTGEDVVYRVTLE
jgi:glucose/arabinose dehydrogenase